MGISISTFNPLKSTLASPQRGASVGAGRNAVAMAPDALKLGKRNDTVARMFIKLGKDAVQQEKWESVASPFRKAVGSAATQAVALDAFDAIGTALKAAAAARRSLDSDYTWQRETIRKLDTLKTELETTQGTAIDLACTFATSSAQALIVVERTTGHGRHTTEIAFERAIALGKTVEELIEVASKASEMGFQALAEKATDKALELAGNSTESALRVAGFASEKGYRGLAERAADKASNSGK